MVLVEDDAIYEEEEEFRLVLGTPESTSAFGASIGEQKETLVKIKDEEDSEFITHFVLFPLWNAPSGMIASNVVCCLKFDI